MKTCHLMILLALGGTGAAIQAAAPASQPARAGKESPVPLVDGKVLEVDRREARVVIDHGPIPSLGMGPMAMEFVVPDKRLLASLKPGDRIRFSVRWKDGDYVLTGAQIVRRAARRDPVHAPK